VQVVGVVSSLSVGNQRMLANTAQLFGWLALSVHLFEGGMRLKVLF